MIATGSNTKVEEEEEKLSATAERFCRRFSLAEIQSATQDFSEAHLVGHGGFGKVYKGQIDDDLKTVAIKRLAPNSNQGEGEFLMEIETLSKLRHVNLVSLIGYCNRNGEMILVYEYIPRGTLAEHLYRVSRGSESCEYCSSLTWKQRLNICIGAARGIDYLHTGSSIIHRDVKSTNILLDENFTAKVSDFGLAKHLSVSSSNSHVSTQVKGSFGYLDPSYFTTGRLTRKSDTYAFGVVLLEVLCGRPAVDHVLGEDAMSLVMWAQGKISKGKADQIAASNLINEISADCLKTFVGIVKGCLNYEPKMRPTMAQIVVKLEFALEQQDRKAVTLNASRFLPLFWNRVKPSGSSGTGSTQQEQKQGDVNMLPVTISIHELNDITHNFSPEYLIGEGYKGNVYRGTLRNGQDTAIKRLHFRSLPDKEFLELVSMISSLKHENVAQLLGYCIDGLNKVLVYEFAQYGSLYDILHGFNGRRPVVALSWAQRVKIAIGAAKGLEYILRKKRVNCNIKSSNILIYDDQGAKLLADFGWPSPYENPYVYGDYHPRAFTNPFDIYRPGYIQKDELSLTTDVYNFGMVLLELMTGRKVFDHTQPRGQKLLVEWATPMLKTDKVCMIVDARLDGCYTYKAVSQMAAIAASCLESEAKNRPDMSSVVRELCLDDSSAMEKQSQ